MYFLCVSFTCIFHVYLLLFFVGTMCTVYDLFNKMSKLDSVVSLVGQAVPAV